MGIQTQLTTAADGSTHRIILVVVEDGNDPGATVDAEISWTPSELGNPANVFPTTGLVTSGKVSWGNVTVDTRGTAFTVDLTCQGTADSEVQAEATQQGGAPHGHRKSVDC